MKQMQSNIIEILCKMNHTSNPLSVRGITLTCYTNSCCLLKEMSDIFRNKNSGQRIDISDS